MVRLLNYGCRKFKMLKLEFIFFSNRNPFKSILHAKRMKTGHQIEFHVCMCLCAKKKNREKTLHRCKFKVIPY